VAPVYKTRAGEIFPALPEGYRFVGNVGRYNIMIVLEEFVEQYEEWDHVASFKDHYDGTISTSTHDYPSLAEAVATVLAQRRLGV
jgi:hypothetical protein